MARQIVALLVLFSFALCLSPRASAQQVENGPPLLTFDELVQLYQQDVPQPQLQAKLDRLLSTPFVNNKATTSGVGPLKPSSPVIGKFLRVAEWNIERGLEFDAVNRRSPIPR